MKKISIIILLFSIITFILTTNALAITTYVTNDDNNYTYAEGMWDTTYSAYRATDQDWATYGKCNETNESLDCLVMMNFTNDDYYYNYDTILWLSNVSNPQISNGEDMSYNILPECYNWTGGKEVEVMVRINNSAANNISYYCSIAPDTWTLVGNVAAPLALFWDSRLSLTDNQPSVWIDQSLNGTTKDCVDEQIETIDVVFHVNDSLDTEFDCCPIVNDVNLTERCNSSIQNFTDSVFYGLPLSEGRTNEIYVECQDEHQRAWSDTLYVIGESNCTSCGTSWMSDMIVAAVCMILLTFFAASYFSKDAWKFWTVVVIIIVAVFILWWLSCWNNLS